MSTDRARKRGSIPSAPGLTEPLKVKAQSRRERHRAVTEISRHDPPPRNSLVPELRIDFVPTESLKPANRQTRRKEAAQARRLDRSIAKFGITAPFRSMAKTASFMATASGRPLGGPAARPCPLSASHISAPPNSGCSGLLSIAWAKRDLGTKRRSGWNLRS